MQIASMKRTLSKTRQENVPTFFLSVPGSLRLSPEEEPELAGCRRSQPEAQPPGNLSWAEWYPRTSECNVFGDRVVKEASKIK